VKQSSYIFWGVLLSSFTIHVLSLSLIPCPDLTMWANQIEYVLNHDPRAFDFYLAYGHPGTTLVQLGSLLHIVFGIPYEKTVILSMSMLLAGVTSASAVTCFLLHRQSLWWLTTAITLTVSRFYFHATPPTALVLPFTVLMVLTSWWLWESDAATLKWRSVLWGAIVGLSAATRLDASLLTGVSLGLVILYRHRSRAILYAVVGAASAFFVADPFLWFMPWQHSVDLVRKFLIHYNQFRSPSSITPRELLATIPLSVLCIFWWLLLPRFRAQARVAPFMILGAFLGITLLATVIILSSSFQDIRYFYPFLIVWEVFLPLFILETLARVSCNEPDPAPSRGTVVSMAVVVCVLVVQYLSAVLVL